MKHFFSKTNMLLVVVIMASAFLVLYLSWVSTPKLGSRFLFPEFISQRIDKLEYSASRTAVPMVFISFFTGIFLILKKIKTKWWFIAFVLMGVLVFLAELGQIFRPYRVFDVDDIKWGIVGSALGLLPMYGLYLIIKCIRK